jgi:ornithine cyclodeaminase/alanine dehydrogenase
MELVYLSRRDVEDIGMTMAEVLEAVDGGFRLKGLGKTEVPPKPGIHPRPDCFIHAMPAYVAEVEAAGLKWVSGYPPNPAIGLPYISGLIVLNEASSGLPLAVMDATWITAMRTGASAGVCAKYLAKADSSVAAIIGCGVQNRCSLAAFHETLPQLREVRCYDVLPEASRRFVAEMGERYPALTFVICDSAPQAVRPADVVVSAIPIVLAPQPDLEAGMLKQGALAVALDYDSAWSSAAMRECDKFCSDDVSQLLATRVQGHYFGGIPEAIHADLGELAAQLKPGRESPAERIFAMNMGIAVADIVTAQAIYERALTAGVGTRLPL